jgi:hypothetical protein
MSTSADLEDLNAMIDACCSSAPADIITSPLDGMDPRVVKVLEQIIPPESNPIQTGASPCKVHQRNSGSIRTFEGRIVSVGQCSLAGIFNAFAELLKTSGSERDALALCLKAYVCVFGKAFVKSITDIANGNADISCYDFVQGLQQIDAKFAIAGNATSELIADIVNIHLKRSLELIEYLCIVFKSSNSKTILTRPVPLSKGMCEIGSETAIIPKGAPKPAGHAIQVPRNTHHHTHHPRATAHGNRSHAASTAAPSTSKTRTPSTAEDIQKLRDLFARVEQLITRLSSNSSDAQLCKILFELVCPSLNEIVRSLNSLDMQANHAEICEQFYTNLESLTQKTHSVFIALRDQHGSEIAKYSIDTVIVPEFQTRVHIKYEC